MKIVLFIVCMELKMNEEDWLKRITVDPAIFKGKPIK
jgi:uncharacterized protein (DUF433 family)